MVIFWVVSMPRVLNLGESPEILAHFRTHNSWPAGTVYIGRGFPKLKIPGSKWGTFHVVRMTLEGRHGTREEIIVEFERDLYGSVLINDIHELRGCDLLCWCTPRPCHGDVLLRLANAAAN
jgi:hypothetical protein